MSTQSELARLAETTIPPSGRDTRAILYLKSQNANALNGTEFRWRHYQPWLEEKGYLLRPRYHPQWQPVAQRTYVEREDSLEATVRVYNGIDRPPELNMRQSTRVLDATRVSDGSQVLLKVIQDDPEHLLEHDILKFLCSPHLKTDPRNHTVDLLDVFKLPNSGQTVLVMPLLREFHDPRFDTVGEAIEFFRQIFEVRHIAFAPGVVLIRVNTETPAGHRVHARARHRPWVRALAQYIENQFTHFFLVEIARIIISCTTRQTCTP